MNNDVYYSSESENEDEHPNLISQERREGEKENNEEGKKPISSHLETNS